MIIQAQVNSLSTKNADLQKQVNELKANIEKLTLGDDEQIDLSIGFYTVGLDLPEGTYTINAKSGSGNLFIHSSSDDLIVNEIMGFADYDTPVVNNVPLKKDPKLKSLVVRLLRLLKNIKVKKNVSELVGFFFNKSNVIVDIY